MKKNINFYIKYIFFHNQSIFFQSLLIENRIIHLIYKDILFITIEI